MTLLLANAFFLCAMIINFAMIHMRVRRTMLTMSIAYSILYALSLGLQNELSGAFACIIAALCMGVNAFADPLTLRQTFKKRMIIVIAACAGVASFTVRGPADLLPFISMTGARMAETFDTDQKIRIGLSFTGFIWMAYLISTGNMFMTALHGLAFMNTFYAIYRHSALHQRLLTRRTTANPVMIKHKAPETL